MLSFLGQYRGRVAVCLLLLFVNLGIEMAQPQIVGSAITNLGWHLEWGAEFAAGPYVLLFVALALVRAGVGHLLGPIRNQVVHGALGDIRGAVYDAAQRLSFSYHDRTNSGELISRATTDVWRLQDFLFACLLMAVDTFVALVATLALVFVIAPMLGWITLAAVVPCVLLLAYYARQLQPQWRKVHDLHGEMATVVQENIAGVRVVKAFAREAAQVEKFTRKRDTYLDTLMRTVSFWSARVPLAQFIFGLGMPLVLWAGGLQVIRGEIPLGDLVKTIFYLLAIGNRMGSVGQFVNILQNASASAERLAELIEEPRAIVGTGRTLPPGPGLVEFEGVSFEYQSGKASLRDVSFRVEPGETCAIVGPTGSGKSTLVHLLPRFYDPSAGCVRIDGTDVRDVSLRDLRRQIGLIFQETFLFSATVAENIAFGRPDARRSEIETCARAAQAHAFILGLEKGYDTIIGERGVTLSGGQRQRIALARTMLMQPRILILDDATASVDSGTEHAIQDALRTVCAGRTTFVIAHRFSTVQHAHRILVLDQGRLVETGTHAELIAREGFYASFFRQQILRPDPTE